MGLFVLLFALAAQADFNQQVLSFASKTQLGGSYTLTDDAIVSLGKAITIDNAKITVTPSKNTDACNCTTATYMALLQVIRDAVPLDQNTMNALMVNLQKDGHGVWGRWNANGPGPAVLFHELKLGNNYTSWDQGKPGDFAKFFWNDEIGAKEKGHLVVYLGTVMHSDGEYVRWWSCNQGMGMKIRERLKSDVHRVIFSRLENPAGIRGAASLPETNQYLVEMGTRRGSEAELYKMIGLPIGGK